MNSGDKIISSDGEGSLGLWDLSDISKSKFIAKEIVDQGFVKIVNIAPAKKIISTIGDKEPTIRFWNFSGQRLSIKDKNNTISKKRIYDKGAITSATFSPDGQLLVTIGGSNSDLKIWKVDPNLKNKEIKLTKLELKSDLNTKNIRKLVVDQNSKEKSQYIAAAAIMENNRHKVKLLNISIKELKQESEIIISNRNERELNINSQKIKSLTFIPDDKLIITGVKDKKITLWNWELNSEPIPATDAIPVNETKELKISISSDGKLLAATGDNGEIQLWRLTPKVEKIHLLNANQARIYSISFSQNNNSNGNRYLLTGGNDKTVRLWEISKLDDCKTCQSISGRIKDIGIGKVKDGRERLVILKENGEILLRELENESNEDDKSLKYKNSGNLIKAKSLAISPDQEKFAILGFDGSIKILNFDKTLDSSKEIIKEIVYNFREKASNVDNLILPNEAKILTTSKTSGRTKLQNKVGEIRYLNSLNDEVTSASFSPDGKIIATGNRNGKINLWNLKGNLIKKHFIKITGEVKSVQFTPYKNYIVTISSKKEMILHKLDENFSKNHSINTKIPNIRFEKTKVAMVDFSPANGKFANLIATADDGKLVKIWDFKGRQLAQFRGHWEKTLNISFSPNGKYIVAAGDNGVIERWQMKDLNTLLDDGCKWFEDYEYSLKISGKNRSTEKLCSSGKYL